MTRREAKPAIATVNSLFSQHPRDVVKAVLQEVLKAEMTEAARAAKGERSEGRLGCRSGSYDDPGEPKLRPCR